MIPADSLEDRSVLVAGGAGAVGEGIVRVLLRRGAQVLVPSRSTERLAVLRGRLDDRLEGRLRTTEGDIGSESGAASLASWVLETAGRLDAVVASLGSWWSGPSMTALPLDDWHRVIESNLTSHVLTARTFLPLIADAEGASYTMINGSGAYEAVAGAGPANVAAAGQMMLKDVLAREHQDRPVRINTLLIRTPVRTRSRTSGEPGWVDADDVGEAIAGLLTDDRDGETVPLPR